MERLQTCERPSLPQGGGVYVKGGNVNFQGCNIYDSKAKWVSAHAFHLRSMAPMELTTPSAPITCAIGPGLYLITTDLPLGTKPVPMQLIVPR